MIVVIDHRLLRLPRESRTAADVIFDRSTALMLQLLIVTRLGARSEIDAYHDLLEQRATQGARMGDS